MTMLGIVRPSPLPSCGLAAKIVLRTQLLEQTLFVISFSIGLRTHEFCVRIRNSFDFEQSEDLQDSIRRQKVRAWYAQDNGNLEAFGEALSRLEQYLDEIFLTSVGSHFKKLRGD